MKGGDLQVLEFATDDMKKVEKYAKKYGILYSVLPDADRKKRKDRDYLSHRGSSKRQYAFAEA